MASWMKNIDELKDKVQNLQEVDIGDFRRRLSMYIYRFTEELDPSIHSQQIKSLNDMKDIVLYENLQDIEDIRQSVLDEIENIKKE